MNDCTLASRSGYGRAWKFMVAWYSSKEAASRSLDTNTSASSSLCACDCWKWENHSTSLGVKPRQGGHPEEW